MNLVMNKETRLNVRIRPELKADLDVIADFHGLTVSSFVHSVLIKKVREEKESNPHIFNTKKIGRMMAEVNLVDEEENIRKAG
jgi:uncharacterized protein (DUF1778 family)